MEIKVIVKQLGKKHPVLAEQKLDIDYNDVNISLERGPCNDQVCKIILKI